MGVHSDQERAYSCCERRLISATAVAICVCVLVQCCECIPLPTECLVGLGYYTPNGTNSCRPCTVCNANQGVRSPCTETNDTDCEDCAEGTYSKVISSGRTCYPCTVCAQEGKREVSPCSATDDSICGECATGYFLYIDSGGSKCKVCSQCPHDRVVIHWIECAEAHLPLDMQCAPEETNSSVSTTSTTATTVATSSTSPTAATTSAPNTIPLDRGGFINQSTVAPLTTATPPSYIGIVVSIISVLFTLTTMVIFFLAFGCVGCCYLEDCRQKYKALPRPHRDDPDDPDDICASPALQNQPTDVSSSSQL